MHEEHHEEQVAATETVAARKSGSSRLKWTAFVLTMVAISGVATAGALGGAANSGGTCEIQKAVLAFVGGTATKVEAATEEEAGTPVPCHRRQEVMKAGLERSEAIALAASSEGEVKTCDKAKAASSEGEAKTCDKAKAASSEGEKKEGCCADKAKAASSEGEAKTCDKAKAASSEGEAKTCDKAKAASSEGEKKECCADKAKAASSEGEAKTCDKAKAASSEGEAKVCPITGKKTTASV